MSTILSEAAVFSGTTAPVGTEGSSIIVPANSDAATGSSLSGAGPVGFQALANRSQWAAAITTGPDSAQPYGAPPVIPSTGFPTSAYGAGSGPCRIETILAGTAGLPAYPGSFLKQIRLFNVGLFQLQNTDISDPSGQFAQTLLNGTIQDYAVLTYYAAGEYVRSSGATYMASNNGRSGSGAPPTDGGSITWVTLSTNPQWVRQDLSATTESGGTSAAYGYMPKLGSIGTLSDTFINKVSVGPIASRIVETNGSGVVDPTLLPSASTVPTTATQAVPTNIAASGTAIPLLNSWAPVGNPVQYWKDASGMVHLQGLMDASAAGFVLMWQFPSGNGLRPLQPRFFTVATSNSGGALPGTSASGSSVTVWIDQSGNVSAAYWDNSKVWGTATYFDLSSISYLGQS